MEFQAFLIKYAEIGIKGKNRGVFEDALLHQMRVHLKHIDGDFRIVKEQGRIYLQTAHYDFEEVVRAMQHVFGITKICPVVQVEDNGFENLAKAVADYVEAVYGPNAEPVPGMELPRSGRGPITFKVETRRPVKTYPMNSMEISAALGEAILDRADYMKVDVHSPMVQINVEIRQGFINIYSAEIPGAGGMPLGTNGKAMLLLSGGIDSPVAGYMISRRGVKLDATYFHAPPYTSERAKEKVVTLAKKVAEYSGPIELHVVNFTDIQLAIYENCPHDELTIIMRRYMMRIAERIATETGSIGLITGESIGQVASQTMASMAVTNAPCTLPVYRPLIGFDKEDIVTLSKKIGTFETSIEPFEDCCPIFVAKHPVTKPNLHIIEASEKKLLPEIDEMVEKAIREAETIWCGFSSGNHEEE